MKVKTNVLFNGPHLEEELEEWLNEPHEGRLVNLILTERPDEPQRVIARAIFSTKEHELRMELVRKAIENEAELAALKIRLADIEAETNHAHQEVGALVSLILEVHRLASDTTLNDAVAIVNIGRVLSKVIEPHPTAEGATVVNLTRLVPFSKLEMKAHGFEVDLENSPQG